MALDVTLVEPKDVSTRTFRVELGAVGSIAPGKPVMVGGTGNNYVVVLGDADPVIGTNQMVGISATTSTDTVAADGTVDVLMVQPGVTVMRCKAKSAAAIDTDAELLAILNDPVLFDLTSSTFTVDTAVTAATSGLVILDGNISEGTVDFMLKPRAGYTGDIA